MAEHSIPAAGDTFPNAELPNHRGECRSILDYNRPSELDHRLGFDDGYPLIVVFYRGYFCPRDQKQMQLLTSFQEELQVNYARLLSVGVDPPAVQAAFRAGLGADWPFLSDEDRSLTRRLGLLDTTEGEHAYRSRPYAFVLGPEGTVHTTYDGWYFVGRPTLDELRRDLRAILSHRSSYDYDAWTKDSVQSIRIPQQRWRDDQPDWAPDPHPDDSDAPFHRGTVTAFDESAGYGVIHCPDLDEQVFFHFTAIPGEGSRSIPPNTDVRFELVETSTGLSARTVQPVPPS